MSVKAKIALVTGANRGIGYAIAKTLAMRGSIVLGTATTSYGVKIINEYLGINGSGFLLNVNNIISINQLLKKIRTDFGYIDILVNNAGIIRDNLLIRMKETEWQEVLETNLYSVFRLSKAVISGMIKNRWGRIINIGSVVGSMGNPSQTNYASAKAGLIGFSKALAREVASRGITVNTVSPGFIETDMTKTLTTQQRSYILKNIPAGRLGNTQEVANSVAFLASDEASYITGETLHVNGGMYVI